MASETVRSVYISGLRNAHAFEQQALQVMERQVERVEHYPEMEQALRRHIEETKLQRQRLEEALSSFGESPSGIKESVMGLFGNMAALAHTPAQDEILKNTFANHAVEAYEIAAYKSLLVMAETAGHSASLPAFRQSLGEEERMAQEMSELAEPITKRYLSLTAAGEGASAKI